VAGHVADHHAEPPGGQPEHVVPVATDAEGVPGNVPCRHLHPGHRRQRGRQQAPLQRECGGLVQPGGADLTGQARPVGDELHQPYVVVGEPAGRERADVQHADDLATDHHRHAEQRPDAGFQQNRIDHVAGGHVGEDDRFPGRRNPAGEPAADRDPEAAPDLLLQPPRGGGDQLA
jgi:hypothetical protein